MFKKKLIMKNKIFGIIMLIPFFGFSQLQSGDILIESNYGFVGEKGLWGAIVEEFGSEVKLVGPNFQISIYDF